MANSLKNSRNQAVILVHFSNGVVLAPHFHLTCILAEIAIFNANLAQSATQ
jgi:hypothetical protein